MACNDRQLSQAQREAGFDQQRTGVPRAVRPFSGPPTIENLVDYLNRELVPGVQQTRGAVNDVFLQVVDQAPSANPLSYYFAVDTAATDPTVGRIKLNASPQNTATIIRVSQSNARLQDVTPWLDVMSGGPTVPLGTVTLIDSINPGRFVRADLNTMTDQGAYWDLGITVIESSHDDPFVEDEAVVLAFIAGVSGAGSTVPVGSLSPIAPDTFLGNITVATAPPQANLLANIDSASIIYVPASHTFQRAALTGFAAATQDSNATTSAEPIVTYSASANMSAERVLTSSTSNTVSTAVANQIAVESTAVTGAIAIAANGTASLFAGIRDNGAAETDRTNLNFLSSADVTFVVTDDAANDELEITATIAAGSTQNEGTGGGVTLNVGTKVLAITSNITITGFARSGGNVDGDRFWVRCNDGIECTLQHATGTLANQLSCIYAQDFIVPGRGMIEFRYEGSWRLIAHSGPTRLVARRTVSSADGSYSITPNSETTWFRARAAGAGAGGGGADAGDSEASAGGGGGAGAYFDIAIAITSGNITGQVGGGGAGGSNAGSNGTVGDSTTLTYDGTTYTAGGGGAGFGTAEGDGAINGGQQVTRAAGGTGGSVGSLPTGSIGSDGGDGFPGLMFGINEIVGAASTHMAIGGHGGPSFYGGGAQGGSVVGAVGTSNGTTAQAIGSGGAGGARISSATGTTGATGSAGKDGSLEVEEWAGPVPTFAAIS
jgi:hypothetical protein